MKRRNFMKTAGLASAGFGMAGNFVLANSAAATSNKLPRWRGFNLLDFFSPSKDNNRGRTSVEEFKWMADWGFDFVRVPMAYPRYIKFDPTKNITPDDVVNIDQKVVDEVAALVDAANKYHLNVSPDLHRAPGFCVNAGFNEPYNLWEDKEAQQAFYFHWEMWARQFAGKSREQISFDLVNEPCTREDMNDQHSKRDPIPGELYREVAQNCLNVIRKYNPNRMVVADGNNVGSDVIPGSFSLVRRCFKCINRK